MLNREKFLLLLEEYTSGKISANDRSEFMEAVTSGDYDELLLQHIEGNLEIGETELSGANLPPHRSADILHKILSSEKQNALLIPVKSNRKRILYWSAAAAVLVAVIFSAYFITGIKDKAGATNTSYAKGLEEKINRSAQPLKIEMEEGSIITLQPGSSIHYPAHFLPGRREIFLDGEAFFEVSKNPARPFFVYNGNIVTHVLGTSFNVRTNPKTKQTEVSVRTGRVEVYENKTTVKTATVKKDNGVILFPNQKVVYDQDTRQFVPSLADVPLPIIDEVAGTKMPIESFVFEEAPLRTVLAALEKTYGIDIMAEDENIYKCLFTGDVDRLDLYARLDIICQAVQASYEVKGTKILIKGNGCR